MTFSAKKQDFVWNHHADERSGLEICEEKCIWKDLLERNVVRQSDGGYFVWNVEWLVFIIG